MGKIINKLDKFTANKIAAGEVVDRPASVIKELVENAIDAQGTKIIVEIKDGGKEYIRVTDNGTGIDETDVLIAFERHATSKLSYIEDLDSLLSLGFRGEALASIASVAQVELITKTREDLSGTYVVLHGGEIIEQKEMGCPQGTTLVIKNLFYNTPARYQFMKSTKAETSYISDLMGKFALAHPNISFRFINNGTIVFSTLGSGNVIDNITCVYGKEIAKNMYHASNENEHLSIEAYVSKPSMARGNKQLQGFFVNGRYIKSKMMNDAVLEAYRTLLMVNKFPICFIYVNTHPKYIDVNIHPTKMEIRFSQQEKIKSMMVDTIKTALFQENLIPKVSFSDEKKPLEKVIDLMDKPTPIFIKQDRSKDDNRIENEEKQLVLEDKLPYGVNNIKVDPVKKQPKPMVEETKINQKISHSNMPVLKGIRIFGQLFNSYLIGQDKDNMYLIDQHAAHERILYDWMLKRYENQSILSQRLLVPIVVEVSFSEWDVISGNKEIFKNLGFEMDEFGNNAFILRSVPIIFGEPEAKKFFLEIVDGVLMGGESRRGFRIDKIISMACKGAIKAKDKLDSKEIDKMMEHLAELENPFTCPHGRPIIISMTKYEIEKKFKRV